MRLAPWQDPRHVVLARRTVDLPAGRVVTGRLDGVLMMGGSFPEQLTVVGQGTRLPLTGADLTFDVSLSFYKFVCELVGGHEGLPGRLDVEIGTTTGDDGRPATPRTVPVDVTVRLDKVDDLPCTFSVPDGIASPTTVTVTNASGADLTLGGCEATFLQVDPESVVPVDTYPARCTSAFPVTVPAGGHVDLAFALADAADNVVWNGVLVELLDKRLVATPAAILHTVHELAADGNLSRDLVVSTPVFATGAPPAKWADLVSVEVSITAGSGRPVSTVLSAAKPSRTLEVPTTLDDLVAGTPGGITTVSYQVRNNYTDRQGAWSAPQERSGEEIPVYPNPPEPAGGGA
jgi:hypothetical protein